MKQLSIKRYEYLLSLDTRHPIRFQLAFTSKGKPHIYFGDKYHQYFVCDTNNYPTKVNAYTLNHTTDL